MNVVPIVFTPILFDNGTLAAERQQKVIQHLIDAGCENWAIDIDFDLFSSDPRVLETYNFLLPGNINYKIPQKRYNDFIADPFLWDKLNNVIPILPKANTIEVGVEVSTKAWKYSTEDFYSLVHFDLAHAMGDDLTPILYCDTFSGDSINASNKDWHETFDVFWKHAEANPIRKRLPIGIHLYRGTLERDFPEKYKIVRDYIYSKGYEGKIYITETGFDLWVKDDKCLFSRKKENQRAQADAWARLLEFASTEESIAEVWAFCAWDESIPKKHPFFNVDGTPREAFYEIAKYF